MALRLVDEPKKKRTLQAELERNLKGALKRQGTLNIGFPGGNADEVVYSAGEGTLWVAFGPPNRTPRSRDFGGDKGDTRENPALRCDNGGDKRGQVGPGMEALSPPVSPACLP